MNHDGWMIYGANGYTGKLAAEKAASEGKKPLLAGRSEDKIKPIADALNLAYVIFDLADAAATEAALADSKLVLHCAGPFSATSQPMVDACLKTNTHYIDITGEIAVFEAIHARNDEAKAAGVVLMPGVGFDVVPSDCLAAMLAAELPNATHLEMAFRGEGGTSPGTAKTMVEMLGDGGRERVGGRIVKVGTAHDQKEITFSTGSQWCMTIPWGDVSTAYYSTGIMNIKVYTATPANAAKAAKLMAPLMKVTKLGFVQKALKKQIEKKVAGPDETVRNEGVMNLWGKVTNKAGETREAHLDVAEGYGFTVMASLAIASRILAGDVDAGSMTPSMGLGAEFVLQLPGSTFELLG